MGTIERWLKAYRIGLASYTLLVSSPVKEPERFEIALRLLSHYLIQELGQEPKSQRSFLLSLPPLVLTLLSNVTRQKRLVGRDIHEQVGPKVSAALGELSQQNKEGKLPLLNRAQIWAYHALLGCSGPIRLVRLGRVLFGWGWRQVEKDKETVEKLSLPLEVLRDPWKDTEEKCGAISEMAMILHETLPWSQIENILYQHQFCWPLLVLSKDADDYTLAGGSGPTTTLAFSLPVAVDVSFDGLNRVDLRGMDGAVLVDQWRGHIRNSVRVGKELWRAKHGNYGNSREEILSTSAIFDFGVSQKIACDLAQSGFGSIVLDDVSADAYFAQAFLHRLLGWSSTLMSAASGLIGEQLRHEDGTLALNYKLVPPGGISDKLAYVFSCRTFERVVLPKASETEPTVQTLLAASKLGNSTEDTTVDQTAEILYAYDMQTLADIVQVRGWRQYQYIRCPDVAWAIHTLHGLKPLEPPPGSSVPTSAREERPGLLDAEDVQVQNVIQMLNQSTSRIVCCDTSPIVVASALWYINTYQRKEDPYDIPPSLSWAFIRPLDNELDVRFWQLIWKVMGASSENFYTFIQHPSTDKAVNLLATALNKFESDAYRPSHRAPDIIVIIGTQRFEDDSQKVLNPLSRPFMTSSILKELSRSGRLQGPHDKRLLPLIGKTRIILLPMDEPVAVGEEVSVDELHPREINLLCALSVLEGGFTQQTASLMLAELGNFRGTAIRDEILKPLVRKGALRYGQGLYHIPRNFIQRLRSENEKRQGELAKWHYSAGCALAPYAVGAELPSLALDIAFGPEHIHEAERHFRLAIQYAKPAGNSVAYQASRMALQHISRFVQVPTWGVVDNLLKSGSLDMDAYEMATELLEWQHSSCVKSHPAHLIIAARAAARWSKAHSERSTSSELGHKLLQEADFRFLQALKHCPLFPSEEEFNLLCVLTNYAVYLSEQEPERQEDIKLLSEQAVELLIKGVNPKGAKGEWFELIADHELDHAKASLLYNWGIEAIPEWAQLWIKGLGAVSLAGQSEQVDKIKSTLPPDKVIYLLTKTKGAYQRQLIRPLKHVASRWEEALRLFDRFWGSDPRVRRALEQLRRRWS